MSIERRELKIEGKSYQILVPSVRQSMPLCTRTAVLLGPLLSTLNKDVSGGGMESFTSAIGQVDPKKADALLMDAIKVCGLCCEGKDVSNELEFERHFNEHKSHTFQVMLWCLWEAVKDFFPQLDAFTQIAKAAVASKFQTAGAKTSG